MCMVTSEDRVLRDEIDELRADGYLSVADHEAMTTTDMSATDFNRRLARARTEADGWVRDIGKAGDPVPLVRYMGERYLR